MPSRQITNPIAPIITKRDKNAYCIFYYYFHILFNQPIFPQLFHVRSGPYKRTVKESIAPLYHILYMLYIVGLSMAGIV